VGAFHFGRAVSLGALGNKRVAVLVGTGAGMNPLTGAVENGNVLGVFDMTNPAAPQLIGTVKLPKSPSDVVLRDRKAVVSAEGVGLIVDLTDPTKPRVTGEIPNVSGSIALSSEGLVYSSSMAAEGVKSAVYQPIVLIHPVTAVMVRPETQQMALNQPEDWLIQAERRIEMRVIPYVSGVESGVLEIKQNDEHYLTFTPALPGGRGESVILPGGEIERDSLKATLTVDTPFGTLRSLEREIKVGWADVDVDLNNDTKVDAKDDKLKADAKRAWAFWETRQDYEVGVEAGTPAKFVSSPNAEQRGLLEDLGTVRLTIHEQAKNHLTPDGYFIVSLQPLDEDDVDHNGDPIRPRFALMRKLGDDLQYLTDKKTSEDQWDNAANTASPCALPYDEWKGECVSNADGTLRLPPLSANRTYDFLFRCLDCKADPEKLEQRKILKVEYYANSSASPVVVDRLLTDIRPAGQFMSLRNAREEKPFKVSRYRPLPLDQWTGHEGDEDWMEKVPQNAQQVTVLVHGYNVPHHDAVGSFFPTWFKRLYWAGHQVHRHQTKVSDETAVTGADSCVTDCAHTIAVSWPSNQGGQTRGARKDDSTQGIITGPASAVEALAMYPEDEFHALQMGDPLSQLLKTVNAQRGDRTMYMMAHSLGNVVVNSALSRPGMAGVVDKYVMNEAAMASEVYNSAYIPTDDELNIGHVPFTPTGTRQAERYGYSKTGDHDRPWIDDWDSLLNVFRRSQWTSGVRDLEAQDGLASGQLDPETFYKWRWRQNASRNMAADELSQASSYYSRGDWRGVFKASKDNAQIWSTYNEHDQILYFAWRAMNRLSKPNPGGFGAKAKAAGRELIPRMRIPFTDRRHLDDFEKQRWLLAGWTIRDQFLVFDGQNVKWNLRRQWAELAHWFPAVSKAAGHQKLDDLPSGRNCNFAEFHNTLFGIGFVQSHSYMKMTEYWKVHKAWKGVHDIFNKNGSDLCQ
jgi:hypothetical protein